VPGSYRALIRRGWAEPRPAFRWPRSSASAIACWIHSLRLWPRASAQAAASPWSGAACVAGSVRKPGDAGASQLATGFQVSPSTASSNAPTQRARPMLRESPRRPRSRSTGRRKGFRRRRIRRERDIPCAFITVTAPLPRTEEPTSVADLIDLRLGRGMRSVECRDDAAQLKTGPVSHAPRHAWHQRHEQRLHVPPGQRPGSWFSEDGKKRCAMPAAEVGRYHERISREARGAV